MAHSRNSANRGRHSPAISQEPPEIVSGRWLVKALLATLFAAAAALYCTVCLLFYQGQWQFVFFPPKHNRAPVNIPQLAASSSLPIGDVKFDYTEQGVPLLDGWWIPTVSSGPPQSSGATVSTENQNTPVANPLVILFFPNGRSTLRENMPAFQALHGLGVNVFAFDYRGFGQSGPGHPTERKSYADGIAALKYLSERRHIPQSRIIFYGVGVGAAVAANVAQQSPQIAGLVLENARRSFAKKVKREQHIHVLPLWLIFRDRFQITRIVPQLRCPKLFLSASNNSEATNLYRQASAPKLLVTVGPENAVSMYSKRAWQQAMLKFLNGLPASVSSQKSEADMPSSSH
ncbi:MAG TPA: alpha/beta hydrolase [Acidobacteriaceae bacterium]|nr:alpha/beta hydrolase [Acidobacteriaceae bacterium]